MGSKRSPELIMDPPWRSWRTTSRAARAIRFIETYCIVPKGHNYGQRMKLTTDQKDWFDEILNDGVSAALKSCPRGEGKSTEFAALGLWATFDDCPSGAPQVPVIATTVGQAERSIYSVAMSMVNMEPELKERSLIYSGVGAKRLDVPCSGGVMFPMSNDVANLQGLDPYIAVVDEIGFQLPNVWNSVVLASGKRPFSLVVGVGTPSPGTNNALFQMRRIFKEDGIPPGTVYREHAAPEKCDIHDEANWYLASSALRNGYKSVESFRSMVRMMTESQFRMYFLGQWVEGAGSWLGDSGSELWDALVSPYDFVPDLPLYIGLDVGLKRDSTALVMGQKRVVLDPANPGLMHYKLKSWSPILSGAIDLSEIMEYIRNLDRNYSVSGYYDPRLFEVPGAILRDEGIKLEEFPQSMERMTPAAANLYHAIHEKGFTVDADQQFKTQVLNAVPRYNDRGFMLSKDRSDGKIDAVIGLMLAQENVRSGKRLSPVVCV